MNPLERIRLTIGGWIFAAAEWVGERLEGGDK